MNTNARAIALHRKARQMSQRRDWHWCAYCWKGKRIEKLSGDYCCHSSRIGDTH